MDGEKSPGNEQATGGYPRGPAAALSIEQHRQPQPEEGDGVEE